MTVEAIFTQALALPPDQRLTLIEQLRATIDATAPQPREWPIGVPIPGRCQGMLIVHAEDEEHLNDFAEYMP
jgi:hypothetical protein